MGCRVEEGMAVGGPVKETSNPPAIRALRPPGTKAASSDNCHLNRPKHVWAIRARLELPESHGDLALFAFDLTWEAIASCNSFLNSGRAEVLTKGSV